MESTFYSATTYWVLFVDIVVAIATMMLFKAGKAPNTVVITVGVLFAVFIALMHWIFGGQNILPTDLSGATFYGIILGRRWALVLLFYITVYSTSHATE